MSRSLAYTWLCPYNSWSWHYLTRQSQQFYLSVPKVLMLNVLWMDPWWSHQQVQTDANAESDTEASHNAQKMKEWTKGMNRNEVWNAAGFLGDWYVMHSRPCVQGSLLPSLEWRKLQVDVVVFGWFAGLHRYICLQSGAKRGRLPALPWKGRTTFCDLKQFPMFHVAISHVKYPKLWVQWVEWGSNVHKR